MTEESVLMVVEEIVTKLSPKLTFGFYDIEDIQQEGRIRAMTTGLATFDDTRFTDAEMAKALERFLRIHVTTRMKNFRRDNVGRSEKPVNPDKVEGWEKRNRVRRNIMRPACIHEIAHEILLQADQAGVVEEVHHSHLMDLINRELPVELRTDFLRMCDGVRIPKPRQTKVREAIAEIIKLGEELTYEEEKNE
jgi:hypothetical protein